jgi:hypothetical protein
VTGLYLMNPVTDRILLSGEQLTAGMLGMPEEPDVRRTHGSGEEAERRAQLFRRVIELRRFPAYGEWPARLRVLAEWIDGYQEVATVAMSRPWIVQRPDGDSGVLADLASPAAAGLAAPVTLTARDVMTIQLALAATGAAGRREAAVTSAPGSTRRLLAAAGGCEELAARLSRASTAAPIRIVPEEVMPPC